MSDAMPLLFISHRHSDEDIASAISSWVGQWSLGDIEIFQSSKRESAPRIGEQLTDELLRPLRAAQVVILVYTTGDQDWSYCMWECGVATDPGKPDTRVVVIQLSTDVPRPFQDRVRVDATSQESVHAFARDFLTDPKFFPRLGRPLAKNWDPESENVGAAGDDLYERLQEFVDDEGDAIDSWPSLPFVRLALPLDDVGELKKAMSEDRLEDAHEVLLAGAIEDNDRVAGNLFGMPNFRKRATLNDLVQAWRDSGDGAGDESWIDNMLQQLSAAAQWRFPRVEWSLFRCPDGKWYSPLVNWVRIDRVRRQLMIDLHFVPFTIEETANAFEIPVRR